MAVRESKRQPVGASNQAAFGVRGYRIRDVAKANERRREILMGAARAFAHGGYDATNIEQIANECGLAKGHLYHYFRSKQEIFTEIRIEAHKRAIERLATIAPAADNDPEIALRKAISVVIGRTFNAAESYDDIERFEPLLGNPVSLSPENRQRIRTLARRYNQMFAKILLTGMNKRIFIRGDTKLMTAVILRAATSVHFWYRAGGKWKPKWIVEQITEQLVRSVRQPG
jgi:AcrR family transcriptional regulator